MKDIFDTDKKRESAIANFRSLQNHPGWILLVEILNENIEVVKNQILYGVEEETKDTIDRLRDRLDIHEAVINTPGDTITDLTSVEEIEPTPDPFETVSELRKRKKHKD